MPLDPKYTNFSHCTVEETDFTLPILEILFINNTSLLTADIKKKAESMMLFSNEDLELRSIKGSKRHEAYWKQKLGNIVSNRNANKPNMIKDGYADYADSTGLWTITDKGLSYLNQHKR